MVEERWAIVILPTPQLLRREHYAGPVPQEETLLVPRLVEVDNFETHMSGLLKTADPTVNRGWVRRMMDRMGEYGAFYLVECYQVFSVVVVNLVEGSGTRLMEEPTIVMNVKRGMLL